MENKIRNVSDITYMSELTQPLRARAGLIRPDNLRSLAFRKLWAH